MSLKLKLDKAEWEGLDEGIRGLYEEKDGAFQLAVDGLEDTSGLKSALEKERADRAKYEKSSRAWEKFGKTPEQIQELIDKAAEDERKRLESKGEWDKLKEQLTQQHAAALAEKDKTIDEKDHAIEEFLIDSRATDAIAKNDGNVTLLLPHVKSRVRVAQNEGKYSVQVLAEDGKTPLIDGKGNLITIEDFVKSLRENEIFQMAFKARGGTGSGASGGGTTAPSGVVRLSREEARDQRKFEAAYARAQKEGLKFELTD